MSFRRRREVKQRCSMTGKPKRPWRSQWAIPSGNVGLLHDEPVTYNAAPGPKPYRPGKRAPLGGYMLDLLSAMHAVRLGIPLSPRGEAIIQMHFYSTLHPQQA